MSLYDAQRQFEENLRLFADPSATPEKYNLYAGLLNLTKGLVNINSEIEHLEQEIRRIKQRIG